MTPITRVLVANRGEIAVRIIRACHDMEMAAVAVYSDADAGALHVRRADQAVRIGTAAPAESYLNIPALLRAAFSTRCDAVHPGYGFLSENPTFAQAVIDAGLTWIGPPPDAIRAMGSKTEARARMEQAGVPIVPGYQGDSDDDAPFIDAADRIGYPVMVKAAGGGGGRGIRVVRHRDDLPDALAGARREAAHAFGDARIFLERYIDGGRHIEIQVLADAHGNIVHLFERECSAQRRHQKVIEEAPSPLVTPALRTRMGAAGVEAARAVGYVNAGTVEFIADAAGNFYFLEMNTRLQVEHPVTEAVTGHDLVRLQLMIAQGKPLPFAQTDLHLRGHAIEARLYAEDPRSGFLPAPGTLTAFSIPHMPGVRVDAGVTSGDAISMHYDPMIAKIIAFDSTRDGAIRRLDAALAAAIIDGTATNRDFLRALIAHPTFAAGEVDTPFIERHLDSLIAAMDSFAPSADRVTVQPEPARFVDPWARADGFRLGQGENARPGAAGAGQASRPRDGNVQGARRPLVGAGMLTAPMPGQVRDVQVIVGEAVKRGQTLVLLEAMKMEIRITAPGDGVVRAVHVQPGQTVERDQPVVELA
ncbi:MAG: acetyl-CoA carboxylase biotin carboxylase subunit [bacterium]|nr:acetyl-CoA carboxylase biotin carboxylase subunit [bacterium]